MMRLRVFLSVFLLFFAIGASAAEVAGLFEAEVSVADRSSGVRQEAIARALSLVLVKASGHGDAGSGDWLAPDEAARFVQQYRYREQREDEGEITSPPLVLWVRFDPDGVKRLLRERGLPEWGSARPLTLVWLAIEQDGRRQLVGANDGGAAREVLAEAGGRRGLPVRLPLLDLTDQSNVRPADIWGDFHGPIFEISKRYYPQAILVGRLFPVRGGRWTVRWTLYQGGQSYRWGGEGTEAQSLVALGVEGAADRLSAAFTRSPELAPGGNLLAINVSAVEDLAGFRRLMDYLEGLNSVQTIRVADVESTTVRLQLAVNGGTERLVNTLALGDTLVVEGAGLGAGSDRALFYRLEP